MSLRTFLCHPRVLVQIGMSSLIAGTLCLHFLPVGPHFSEGAKDGISGFFYGVAIGTLLVAVKRKQAQAR